MTSTDKARTITLTGRPPVRILESAWPVIAVAEGDTYAGADPALRHQARDQGDVDVWSIRVRQHADGRAIVYGRYREGRASAHMGLCAAGRTLAEDEAERIPEVIGIVGRELGLDRRAIEACIADLPPVELDEAPTLLDVVITATPAGDEARPSRLAVGSYVELTVIDGTNRPVWADSVEVLDESAEADDLAQAALEDAGFGVVGIHDAWEDCTDGTARTSGRVVRRGSSGATD
jgi:hypothetical protein